MDNPCRERTVGRVASRGHGGRPSPTRTSISAKDARGTLERGFSSNCLAAVRVFQQCSRDSVHVPEHPLCEAITNVRFGWWSQAVDATLYALSGVNCVEDY